MSLRNAAGLPDRSTRPLAMEFATVTTILIGIYLWQQTLRAAVSTAPDSPLLSGGLLVDGFVTGGLFVVGLALFAFVYTDVRTISRGLRLPSRSDLGLVGIAACAPLVLAGITKLVGTLTDVPYHTLTMYSVAADAPLEPIVAVAALGIAVGVPTLVIVCQLIIQGSFNEVVDGTAAVVLTTLVTAFVLVSDTGGLSTVPERGKLLGAALFTVVLSFGIVVTDRVESARLRLLGVVPLFLFVSLLALSGIAGIESIARGLFVLTHLAVLGIAAYTFERTDSLCVPALAYASLFIANRLIVVSFEAGLQSW